jgi:ABC-type sugar transport system substrate-binding protein
MKALSVAVLTLAATLVSAGPLFAGGSAEQPKRGAGLKIALVVKNKDDAHQGIQQGGLAAAKDLGNVDVIFQGPATPTAAAQAEIINELVSQKVNAIVVSPSEVGEAIDPLLRALKKAVDAGIKVVSLDQTIAAGGPLLDIQSPTEETVGRNLVKMMAEQVGESDHRDEHSNKRRCCAVPGAESLFPCVEYFTILAVGDRTNVLSPQTEAVWTAWRTSSPRIFFPGEEALRYRADWAFHPELAR